MSFLDTLVEEPAEQGFSRTDLAPYREVFDRLRPGIQVTITVPTGELYNSGPNKGKGRLAVTHANRFRDVAKEREVGLNVGFTTVGAETRLRLMTGPKREFTEEQVKNRTEAAQKARAKKAVEKLMAEKGMTQAQAVEQYRKDQAEKAKAKAAEAKKAASSPAA